MLQRRASVRTAQKISSLGPLLTKLRAIHAGLLNERRLMGHATRALQNSKLIYAASSSRPFVISVCLTYPYSSPQKRKKKKEKIQGLNKNFIRDVGGQCDQMR